MTQCFVHDGAIAGHIVCAKSTHVHLLIVSCIRFNSLYALLFLIK